MFKLLFILFVIELYTRINNYKLIREKFVQDSITKVWHYELKTKFIKLKTDKVYIKSCKKEDLIPTFAKVILSIKSDD